MSKKKINIEDLNFVEMDDEVSFHCSACGSCCIDRDDILLNAYDVYRISKYLDLSQDVFLAMYCDVYIGQTSNLPVVRLDPVGDHQICRFLLGHKCAIHSVKPSVCALYPLGRAAAPDTGEIKYILQPVGCNDTGEKIKVSDFLENAGITEESNEIYKIWGKMLKFASAITPKAGDKLDDNTRNRLYNLLMQMLYTNYDYETPFIQQAKIRLSQLESIAKEMPRIIKKLNK